MQIHFVIPIVGRGVVWFSVLLISIALLTKLLGNKIANLIVQLVGL